MDTSEHPLLSLDAEKQRELVDVMENGRIDTIAQATGLSRRQVLTIGAALVGSAGAGGFAANEVIGSALAAPSTSDSDGNVGLPGDRVDVFADGVDSNSVNTEQQTIGSGDTINQIEFGSESLNPGASTNNDWSDSATASTQINFSSTFNSAPHVVVSSGLVWAVCTAKNVTTTDFQIRLDNYTTNDPGAFDVFWIAIQ